MSLEATLAAWPEVMWTTDHGPYLERLRISTPGMSNSRFHALLVDLRDWTPEQVFSNLYVGDRELLIRGATFIRPLQPIEVQPVGPPLLGAPCS